MKASPVLFRPLQVAPSTTVGESNSETEPIISSPAVFPVGFSGGVLSKDRNTGDSPATVPSQADGSFTRCTSNVTIKSRGFISRARSDSLWHPTSSRRCRGDSFDARQLNSAVSSPALEELKRLVIGGSGNRMLALAPQAAMQARRTPHTEPSRQASGCLADFGRCYAGRG